MRIVINGFGRIGRTILRQILSQSNPEEIDVVLINDIAPLASCAYLFQYDSTFGPYPQTVKMDGNGLNVGGRYIPFSMSDNLSDRDFTGVDVVLECTGNIPSRGVAERGLIAGARNVLISGPSEFADVTTVIGANEMTPNSAKIVSCSSCTTNAIGPLLCAVDAAAGIERAHITTIHCFTASQPMVDSPRGNLERSRAGAESMVPTTTSAAREIQKILPDIAERTTVAAVRVPCMSVSAIDATLQVKTPIGASPQDFLKAAVNRSSVIGLVNDPCVSRDLRGRPESLILALPETIALGDAQLRVFGWYDNEWGFSARMIEMAHILAARPEEEELSQGKNRSSP